MYPTVYTPWSALFNFFIHDLDNKTKLTLRKYMYADTKLTGVADTPDKLLPLRGTTIGWRNGQTETSQSSTKCRILHLGRNKRMNQ